jgi:hypothetical protein
MVLATPNADALIASINEWHCNVKIRYEFTRERSLPMCAVLLPLATEIVQKTSLPPVAFVDRVSSLNSDGTVCEVHSVGLSRHPYVYARWLGGLGLACCDDLIEES